jgi:hypothetical protein
VAKEQPGLVLGFVSQMYVPGGEGGGEFRK